MKKRVVVICPGRGTYVKETLGYLRQHGARVSEFLSDLDFRRERLKEPTISSLDSAETFQPQMYTRGENASSLIYACAYADFMAIDRSRFEIVAVTGNSMGWYLALAFGGSLDWDGGFKVINTMGAMMKKDIVGGQVIYPLTDEHWVRSPTRAAAAQAAIAKAQEYPGAEVYTSIYLGGFLILGANAVGVSALLKTLPPVENYPFQLLNHAAFHTPLLRTTSAQAFQLLPPDLFHAPNTALIDGRGCIWKPYSTSVTDLYQYTLGQQVTEPYDFTRAINVALKEYAPDNLILLGPGSSLGAAVGQILIENNWHGLRTKGEFTERQATDPFVLAMGRPDQRRLVVS